MVRPKPLPLMTPSELKTLAATVTVRLPVRITGAALKSRLLLPVKMKLPPKLIVPEPMARDRAEPLVLSTVPPLMANTLLLAA